MGFNLVQTGELRRAEISAMAVDGEDEVRGKEKEQEQ